MSNYLIECSGVRKEFRSEAEILEILSGVDLALEKGVRASITGPSGCGKSTFLSILGGLDRPTSGRVIVGGVDITEADEDKLAVFRAREVGFVFQFHYLLNDFTALENVMLPAFMLTGDKAASVEKAYGLLEAVGLGGRMSHVPARLSGGERQRVAIARALVNEPGLILADEPTGNLDRASAVQVEDLLYGIAADSNTTLLVVTHDNGMAARADRRYELLNGRLKES
ncbi:MAG: ABC transporter ATP-binding protein [Spirochaetales bacterium]|nr:ABC transporter ATP-binding protein [Spirochaetales bacterium]